MKWKLRKSQKPVRKSMLKPRRSKPTEMRELTLLGRIAAERSMSKSRSRVEIVARVAMSREMARVLKHWLLRLSSAVILGAAMSELRL